METSCRASSFFRASVSGAAMPGTAVVASVRIAGAAGPGPYTWNSFSEYPNAVPRLSASTRT